MGFHGLLLGLLQFVFVDDVRTSQETHVRSSTACYVDSFTLHMQVIFRPHKKHTYGPP
jgi:hypothetical protein